MVVTMLLLILYYRKLNNKFTNIKICQLYKCLFKLR